MCDHDRGVRYATDQLRPRHQPESGVADAAAARDLASAAHDAESQDLMIERITRHQKTLWMLRSFLKR